MAYIMDADGMQQWVPDTLQPSAGGGKWIPWTDTTSIGGDNDITEERVWKDILTGAVSKTKPTTGEILEQVSKTGEPIQEAALGIDQQSYLWKGSDGYYANQYSGEFVPGKKLGNISSDQLRETLKGAATVSKQADVANSRQFNQTAAIAAALAGGATAANMGLFGQTALAGAGTPGAAIAGGAEELALLGGAGGDALGAASGGLSDAAITEGLTASIGGASGLGATAEELAALSAGVGAGAGIGAGSGAGAGAATGLTLAGAKSVVKDIGSLAAAVTTVNKVLGDPLDLDGDSDTADGAAGDAAGYTKQMADIAKEQWDFYKANYQPVELDLIRQAKEAGSPEEFARARGAANADVTGSFDRARKDILRDSQSRGINPASGAGQATDASIRLAEGATRSGALTGADNLTRNLMWSKGLDAASLGRNIPRDSTSALANAGNTSNQTSQVNSLNATARQNRNNNNIQNLGYGLNAIFDTIGQYGPTVKKWFGYDGGNEDGEYKKGGRVINAKSKRIFGPHMRRYALGGEIEEEGLQPRDMMTRDASQMGQLTGPGTETSDSIPAQVDGQEPAALSTGEFVMSAPVLDMSGEEILDAINQAGLARRQGAGLEPREGGEQAYADGAMVQADGLRADGTQKGSGFLGPMKRPDGRVSTELSIGVPINGQETQIPVMVPTLSKQELDFLLNNDERAVLQNTPMAVSIRKKAVEHAQRRMGAGSPVFAGPQQQYARGGRVNRHACAGL